MIVKEIHPWRSLLPMNLYGWEYITILKMTIIMNIISFS